jgi:prepilin-type N-terminal cleavage/methylation domain-containing protein
MMAERKDEQAGFSLVEMLAACAIMVIIALIVIQFFHKATMLWDVGTRRSDAVMKGRAIANAIVQDLQWAIDAPVGQTNFPLEITQTSAKFWMLGNPVDGKPAMRYISIKFEDDTVTREVIQYCPDEGHEAPQELADEVLALEFTPQANDVLPASITVSVKVSTNYPPFQATARTINRNFSRL